MLTNTLAPVSNRATWEEDLELVDIETGDPLDISAATEITIDVRAAQNTSPEFSLTLTGGQVTVVATGVLEWRAEVETMRALVAKTYEIGCTIVLSGDTIQLIIGRLPVLDGIVS